MNLQKIFTNQKGFMTVEIMVSVFIITMSVLATMNITQRSVYLSRQNFNGSQAVFLVEETSEALRMIRDQSWSNISSKSNAVPYYLKFNNGAWEITEDEQYAVLNGITRKITFENACRDVNQDLVGCGTPDAGTRQANIIAEWYTGGILYRKVLAIYLMNI